MSKEIRDGLNNEIKTVVDEVFESVAPTPTKGK